MTATITRTRSQSAEFLEIELAPNDTVILDFSGNPPRRAPSPNQERGVRVRLDAVTGTGITGSVAMGDALAIDEVDHVAAWATTTVFSVNDHMTEYSSSAHQYLRHEASDDVRRITAYDTERDRFTISEPFRHIVIPTAVHHSADLIVVPAITLDLVETGDALVVDATGGIGGITAGTTYYIIKVTSGAAGIKLATSAANASAGTAVDLTSDGVAADARFDHAIAIENGAAMKMHGEQSLAGGVEIAAGTTAGVLRLNESAWNDIHAGWDLEVMIGTTPQVRRVLQVDDIHLATGQTVSGFSYTAATKEFTSPNANAYRTVETQFALVIENNGGYADLSVGDWFAVTNLAPAARKFKLSGLTLTATTLNLSAVSVASDEFTIATGDAAKLANLVTGTEVRCVAAGGFGGISSEGTYYLIRTTSPTVFKLASSHANALAGTAIDITGSGTASGVRFSTGTPGDIVFSQSRTGREFPLTEPFTGVPPTGTDVHVVNGQSQGETTAKVQTSTAATTTVIPLVTYDSKLSNDHDVLIDGDLRDVSEVSETNKTVTLATALSAAPKPGDTIDFGHRGGAFEADSDITVAAGASAAVEHTIDFAVSAMRFAGTGTGANKAKVRLAATWLPEVKERN